MENAMRQINQIKKALAVTQRLSLQIVPFAVIAQLKRCSNPDVHIIRFTDPQIDVLRRLDDVIRYLFPVFGKEDLFVCRNLDGVSSQALRLNQQRKLSFFSFSNRYGHYSPLAS